MDYLTAKAAELDRLTTPRPLSELTEADGDALLWSTLEGTCLGLVRFNSAVVNTRAAREGRFAWTPLPKVHP